MVYMPTILNRSGSCRSNWPGRLFE